MDDVRWTTWTDSARPTITSSSSRDDELVSTAISTPGTRGLHPSTFRLEERPQRSNNRTYTSTHHLPIACQRPPGAFNRPHFDLK